MTNTHNATLYIVGDRGQTIDGSASDVRGRQVRDKNGEGIGKAADLLVDDQENEVRFPIVEHGGFLGFGETKALIRVDAVTKVTEHDVYVDQSREGVAAAPGHNPDLLHDRPYHESIYNHYGHAPYWRPGYLRAGGMAMSPISPQH